MPDIDPSKWVRMFEELFGPRLGRWMATLLLALGALAALLWLFDVIWKYGGKPVAEALSGISFPTASGLFTATNAPALAATFMFILVIYGAIVVAILYFLGRKLFKKNVSQSALDKLAEIRNEGIDTLYAVLPSSEEIFRQWKIVKGNWEKKLREHVKKNFPKSDYLFVSHLGVVPVHNNLDLFSVEHWRELNFVIRQLEMVEQLLNSYRK